MNNRLQNHFHCCPDRPCERENHNGELIVEPLARKVYKEKTQLSLTWKIGKEEKGGRIEENKLL